MSKAHKQVKKGEKFTPLAHKYEPPYGPKARVGKISGRVQK